jgi:hypothetical protein
MAKDDLDIVEFDDGKRFILGEVLQFSTSVNLRSIAAWEVALEPSTSLCDHSSTFPVC